MSTMGYEIAGGLGAKMALPERDVLVFVGDGSYLMMNSDIYSTVFTGHKVIFIVCDNGGFASINNLQVNQGGVSFNNLLSTARHADLTRVDFAKHAEALGAISERIEHLDDLAAAFERAKAADRSYAIIINVTHNEWTGGGCWWEVGVPEVSQREEVLVARGVYEAESKHQRVGV
jgi:3D-(3,5/4)-trihydroxycyclohexane-1,2-dione acylhydrolase (decyclizing)